MHENGILLDIPKCAGHLEKEFLEGHATVPKTASGTQG